MASQKITAPGNTRGHHVEWLARWRLRLQGGVHRDEVAYGILFLIPTVIGLAVFHYGAMLYSLYLGFTDYNMFNNVATWVGLSNYAYIFTNEPLFFKALGNTVYYSVGFTAVDVVLALGLAMALNMRLPLNTWFRTLYFVPVVATMAAVAALWGFIYHPDFGLLNWLFRVLGLKPVMWLQSEAWAMPSLLILAVWKNTGYFAMFFLAGLQSIPEELHEAAKIDGAGNIRRFRHITLPLISPTTFFVLTLMIINTFQVFEVVYFMTSGGPRYATTPLVYLIYTWAFVDFKMGRASALAWVLCVILMVLTFLQFRSQRRWVFYG